MASPAIAPWRDKLAAYGLGNAVRHIRDAGLAVSSLCRGGMFTAADAAGRMAAIDDNRRAIDEAAALGATIADHGGGRAATRIEGPARCAGSGA